MLRKMLDLDVQQWFSLK